MRSQQRYPVLPALGGFACLLAVGPATASDFEELHEVSFNFPMSPGGTMVAVDQFDDQGGTRQLEEVTIEVFGELGAHVTVENDSVLPAPDLALNMSGLMTFSAGVPSITIGFSGTFLTDGSIGPSDGVPGGGSDFWDFGFVTVDDSDIVSTTSNLDPFRGTGTFSAEVSSTGGFAVTGSTDTTITVMDFQANGMMRVVYGWSLIPTGACCLPGGACQELTEQNCLAAGGDAVGDGTSCAPNPCAIPDRGTPTEKGSLVVFHKVEARWDHTGALIQDTFLSLTNDGNVPVCVQMYFINGDAPVYEWVGDDDHGYDELIEPGWNWIDNEICLTPNQPTYWSACTGRPAGGGLSPWEVLDPDGPGRPVDPMNPLSDRVLRGYVLAWAVNAEGAEIRHNHLKGEGTILGYRDRYAWEYGATTFAVISGVDEGAESDGNPGEIRLDGVEYEFGMAQLLLNFQAADSMAWGDPDLTCAPFPVRSDTDVTLHPLQADLRQETEGPVTTKAHITVWNQNEVKFSGAFRCITCWDQELLSVYDLPDGGPNHFRRGTLQTDHGKARIDGLQSQLCDVDHDPYDGLGLGDDPRDLVSETAALIGVSARILALDPGLPPTEITRTAASGNNLVGMGVETATIRYDVAGSVPEATGDPDAPKRNDGAGLGGERGPTRRR